MLKRIGNEWVAGFAICFLFLLILKLPNQIIDINSHDLGSQVIYEYWLVNHVQFGKDIIQNIGPLGFLFYPSIYTGFLPNIKVFALMFMAISMAIIFYINFRKLPLLHLVISLISLFVSILGTTYDAAYYAFSLLLALQVIDHKQTTSFAAQFICLFLLAILSLTKGTLLIWSLIVIFLRLITLVLQSEYKKVILEGGCFSISFLLIWVVCQQSINNIPSYVFAMLSFSSGYNEAMAIYEKHYLTAIALFFLFAYSYFVVKNYVISGIGDVHKKYAKGFILLLTLFIAWKHGFVRADAHMFIFLHFCMIVAPVYIFAQDKKFKDTKFAWFTYIFVILFVIAGSCKIYQSSIVTVLVKGFDTVYNNAQLLFNLKNYTSRLTHSLQKALQQDKGLVNVPENNREKAIGYWGMLPGIFAYQEFGYSSAPSNISFASWNGWIMNKNRDFYKDSNQAPKLLYVEFETIDNKLIAQDDSLAQLEILHQYFPDTTHTRYVLMKRNKTTKDDWYLTKIKDISGNVNAWLTIPKTLDNSPVWLQVKVEHSLLARITAFFYKPPKYEIILEFEDGSSVHKKYIPKMGEVGFMIRPLISKNADLIDYFKKTSEEKQKIKRLKIDCNKIKFACGSNLLVSFSRVEGL